jgi:4-diphosphocytidyl-2-C-methyl-D-erythritol kinase
MHVSRSADDLTIDAPAKANLFLEVLRKRSDGYHDIATLMVALQLHDTLTFRKHSDLALTCSDPKLSVGPDNLVLKAAWLLQQRTGCTNGAKIHLTKRIPMAAGLAGGSTDAAATLVGLNELWQLGLTNDELAKLGGEIGSDIPFFFHTPAAWCTGRGEIVTPLDLPIPLHFVLLCPAFGMVTASVYKNVAVPQTPVDGSAIRAALAKGDIDIIGRLMHNRLQTAAESLDPRIGEYARLLAATNPAGVLMSGSGSTLFALCRSAEEARRVADGLPKEFKVIVTRSAEPLAT